MDTSPEHGRELQYHYIGRLSELGIGNSDGIPSKLSSATEYELNEYGKDVLKRVANVTDAVHFGCIDGRECRCNADGSKPEIRLGRVGGTASNIEVALNSDAPILKVLAPDAPINEIVKAVDNEFEKNSGIKRSAHLGGCGGANGAFEDNRNISVNDNLANVVSALFSHPAIAPHIDAEIDITQDWKALKQRAAQTADLLESSGWLGQKYVDGVVEHHPHGVEELKTGDDRFHGHAEDSLLIVTGPQTIEMPDAFVWNIEASKKAALALAGEDNPEGYKRALMAEFAKHVAVADRLPSTETPVFIIET